MFLSAHAEQKLAPSISRSVLNITLFAGQGWDKEWNFARFASAYTTWERSEFGTLVFLFPKLQSMDQSSSCHGRKVDDKSTKLDQRCIITNLNLRVDQWSDWPITCVKYPDTKMPPLCADLLRTRRAVEQGESRHHCWHLIWRSGCAVCGRECLVFVQTETNWPSSR